ncbi:MAG: ABC transporter ATP-binding protein [Luteitalea sp.]
MPGSPSLPAVAVTSVGRAFHLHRSDSARGRHAAWGLVGAVPGLRGLAAARRQALGTRFWAIRDVSFTVRPGESVGIIGANGSGKSTLLHLLCATLLPSEGRVQVRGRIGALLELGTGFSPDLTGQENIVLSGLLHGLDRATIEQRAGSIAAFADIGGFLDQPVRTYSTGMYVRLAFAVIAHLDADVLIVDEALAVGDIRFVQKCLQHLERFRSAGGTLLFVSHDLPAVQRLCSRVIWLDRGRLRTEGAPRDVTEAYFDWMIGGTRAVDPGGLASSTRPPVDTAPPAVAVSAGPARITAVRLVDAHGADVLTVRGGERVWLLVTAGVGDGLARPILGFYVKDRLGQQLFGENTLSASRPHPPAPPGSTVRARFAFVMPRLSPGEYLIAVAIAEGSQADHQHHEWRHEAWQFSSVWPGAATGLVGIDVDASWQISDWI